MDFPQWGIPPNHTYSMGKHGEDDDQPMDLDGFSASLLSDKPVLGRLNSASSESSSWLIPANPENIDLYMSHLPPQLSMFHDPKGFDSSCSGSIDCRVFFHDLPCINTQR